MSWHDEFHGVKKARPRPPLPHGFVIEKALSVWPRFPVVQPRRNLRFMAVSGGEPLPALQVSDRRKARGKRNRSNAACSDPARSVRRPPLSPGALRRRACLSAWHNPLSDARSRGLQPAGRKKNHHSRWGPVAAAPISIDDCWLWEGRTLRRHRPHTAKRSAFALACNS